MRVLVIGGSGMLGHMLLYQWRGQFTLAATIRDSREASPLARAGLDIALYERVSADDFAGVAAAIADFKPQVVVNCIGIVKQLAAARDAVPSIKLNALFPHLAAQACAQNNARFIHISTDCVFAGRGGPYKESDVADADDMYGRSKVLGEVTAPGCCTLRTSIIGPELRRGTGLLAWFLSQPGPAVEGYRNALYTGFTTVAFADVVRRIICQYPQLEGLWHVASDPISKYQLLHLMKDIYGKDIRIEANTEFKCDRRLDSSRFRSATGFVPLTWQEMIRQMHAGHSEYMDQWEGRAG